jgi:hypothetical protein
MKERLDTETIAAAMEQTVELMPEQGCAATVEKLGIYCV